MTVLSMISKLSQYQPMNALHDSVGFLMLLLLSLLFVMMTTIKTWTTTIVSHLTYMNAENV